MNILYISALSGNKGAGLTYSVPRQIAAQSEFDNVFWLNIIKPNANKENIVADYHINHWKLHFSLLPKPFDKPELVIFQGIHFIEFCIIAAQLRKKNIPYIIVPRCSLTEEAQNYKKIKKYLGNLFLFNKFIKNAEAIHYLTQDEYKTSGDQWNKKHFVVGNGVTEKKTVKTWDGGSSLNGVFIGRLNMVHKGLDLLVEACAKIKNKLLDNKFKIDIYGPDSDNFQNKLETIIDEFKLNDILVLKGPVYDEEKEKVLLSNDFFVLTSRFEGHPMGLIEACSYGLPCLVTKGTNMGDEIVDYDAGWVCDVNADSIAKSIENLLENKGLLRSKGANALKLSKQYNWQNLAAHSHNIYKNLLEKQ